MVKQATKRDRGYDGILELCFLHMGQFQILARSTGMFQMLVLTIGIDEG